MTCSNRHVINRTPEMALAYASTSILLDNFRVADAYSICNASASWLLVCGSSKQQQIPIRIFDDEIFGAPRLLLQFLAKGNASGLKLKKQ